MKLLTDVYMLQTKEKEIRGRMCYSIYWYRKRNNKYMKDCDPSTKSSYLIHWDVNNLYG